MSGPLSSWTGHCIDSGLEYFYLVFLVHFQRKWLFTVWHERRIIVTFNPFLYNGVALLYGQRRSIQDKLENCCLLALLFVSHITPVPFICQISQLLFQLPRASLSAQDKMKIVGSSHPSLWAVSISPGWHLPWRDSSAASPVKFCSPVPADPHRSPQTQEFPACPWVWAHPKVMLVQLKPDFLCYLQEGSYPEVNKSLSWEIFALIRKNNSRANSVLVNAVKLRQ